MSFVHPNFAKHFAKLWPVHYGLTWVARPARRPSALFVYKKTVQIPLSERPKRGGEERAEREGGGTIPPRTEKRKRRRTASTERGRTQKEGGSLHYCVASLFFMRRMGKRWVCYSIVAKPRSLFSPPLSLLSLFFFFFLLSLHAIRSHALSPAALSLCFLYIVLSWTTLALQLSSLCSLHILLLLPPPLLI